MIPAWSRAPLARQRWRVPGRAVPALLLLPLLLLAWPLAAQEATRLFGPPDAPRRLTLRTTTDISVLAPTIRAFLDARTGLAIDYQQWGSNDLYALTAQDCAQGRVAAGLVLSSAVHQMVKLVNDGCAAPWRSEATQALPPGLRWRDEIWGLSSEPAVIVYNRDLLPPGDVPATRFDLLDLLRREDGAYDGKVATYDIETSGLGFLFAFMDSQEASTFGALMEAFARSGAVATCCSAEIIDGVARGEYLLAYNVLGSYAAEQAAADPRLGILTPRDYVLTLARAAILPGPTARADAGALLDFMLSPAGRRALAASNLIIAPSDPDATRRGRRVAIPLGPTLLVAMDQARSQRFIARWRQSFAQ
ncbi:ABC transporter substrate-binding protein [Pseudooceanicola aestuarii]|uniref:ABC transporter substrate-binding protein n=1 Tax=Pseudooceanicola aestuarii TaxID=2697319 RepID=UPI0013D5093A|nr:ABC transporter substrate-binding protein [Pseudooceanicola aestuarii]